MSLATRRHALAATAFLALAFGSAGARAQDLVVYCGVQEEWCQAMMNAFTKETGIKVAMTRKSAGETYAQIKAESGNPKGDLWWGGTGDAFLQAAEDNLLGEYKSPKLGELHPWAQRQAADSGYRVVGIYAGGLGFAVNTEILAQKKVKEPACWADLVKPEYKGEIQIANPNSSGTAYAAIATLVQIFGENPAYDYLKQLHANVAQYTKSGAAPAIAVARGEASIGVIFMHDAVVQTQAGFPVKTIAPCEGTGYEIGSMAMIKGGPNPELAKKFYEFALTVKGQMTADTAHSYQVQSNVATPLSQYAPRLEKIKLIDYDFKKFGATAERKRLLARWDSEIGSLR
jgi:iron(III) transport system substrate-binding protein